MPDECPQGVVDLFRACIAQDPGTRPSAADVQAALEELLAIPRPGQAEQSVSGELAATSSGGGSAPQPRTPPQMQRRPLGASGAAPKPSGVQQGAPGAVEEGMQGVQSTSGAASAVVEPTTA